MINWIKCEDKMPKPNRNVLIALRYSIAGAGGAIYHGFDIGVLLVNGKFDLYSIDECWEVSFHDDVNGVTHWAEVELPKEVVK